MNMAVPFRNNIRYICIIHNNEAIDTTMNLNRFLPKLDQVLLYQFVFVATGVFQTIGSQYAFYHGAAGIIYNIFFFLNVSRSTEKSGK